LHENCPTRKIRRPIKMPCEACCMSVPATLRLVVTGEHEVNSKMYT